MGDADYKREFNELRSLARAHGYHVHLVPEGELFDYAAMNDLAAKELHWPGKKYHKKKAIYIGKRDYEHMYYDLYHELLERGLMADGEHYGPAHIESYKDERRPFKEAWIT